MLLLSAGKLFQEVGYVRASIHRIAAAVNAPKGTFYNHFGSKEELASILVDRYLSISFSSAGRGRIRSSEASFPVLSHGTTDDWNGSTPIACDFAAEAPAIPRNIGPRIADGIHVWDTQLGDLISRAQIEKKTSVAQDSTKLALFLTTCWFGAMVRKKSDPSLKLVDDFLPSLLRCEVLDMANAPPLRIASR
jgi:TetR/AcrR family transcriptional repressor of nem operon